MLKELPAFSPKALRYFDRLGGGIARVRDRYHDVMLIRSASESHAAEGRARPPPRSAPSLHARALCPSLSSPSFSSPVGARPGARSPPSRRTGPPGSEGVAELVAYDVSGREVFQWAGLPPSRASTWKGPAGSGSLRQPAAVGQLGPPARSRCAALRRRRRPPGVAAPDGRLRSGAQGGPGLDGGNRPVWTAPLEDPAAAAVSAVRLADGATLVTARGGAVLLYRIPPGGGRAEPISLPSSPPPATSRLGIGLARLDPDGQRIALWHAGWPEWYELEWQDGALAHQMTFPAAGGISLLSAGSDGVWRTGDDLNATRLAADGAGLSSFPLPAPATALAAGDGFVFAAFAGPRGPPPQQRLARFSWCTLTAWVAGGLLAAGALVRQARRRRSGEADRIAAMTGAGLLLLGSLLLFVGQRRGLPRAHAAGLWACLHILAMGRPSRRHRPRRRRTGAPACGRPEPLRPSRCSAALGNGWDLAEVPKNVHGDVGLTVAAAREVVIGERDFFAPGYAEIPGPGGLPTQVSLALFGDTMAGARAGVAAVGVLAVLGVFVLGREVRNERTGLFAGILLAGSTPFLHFSRSPLSEK